MKKKREVNFLLIFAILLLLLVMLVIYLTNRKHTKPVSEFSYVKISRSGTMISVETCFELQQVAGEWTATYTYVYWDERTSFSFKADPVFVQEMQNLLQSCRVEKWDGYNVRDNNVTDGENIYFEARTVEGKTIEAKGYMSYPPHFSEVWEGIEALFDPYLPEESFQ